MTDIAELEIRINVSDVERDMRDFERSMRRAEDSTEDLRDETDDLSDSVGRLGDAYGKLIGIVAGLAAGLTINAFIETAQAMETLEDRVLTATGSLAAARDALEDLRAVAAATPLTMEELTFSFQKLVNQGIGVTGEDLQGLAALAVVMGQELETVMDAVRDAVLFGGFDPLEEFGIFAQEQEGKIVATFRGMTTEIENSSDAILGYLTDLGNVQFGAAFENQMDGVTGATSRLDTAMGKLARQFVEAFSPAVAAVIDLLAEMVDAVADATREVLKFFGLIDDRRIEELEQDLETTTEAYWRLAESIQNFDENAQLAAEGTKGGAQSLQQMKDRAADLYDEMRQLEGKIADLKKPTDDFAGSLGGDGGGEGEGAGGLAGAANAARMSLTGLIVSINETKEAFIAAEAASAGFTLASLEGNLRSYTSTDVDGPGGIAFDFANKFWDVFATQGEFTLDSMIGTFQSWGLELAQQIDFTPLFDLLGNGLSAAASSGLSAGLAGFGVGRTAGGLAGGGPLGIFAGAASGALTGGLATGGNPVGIGIGAVAGGLGAALGGGTPADNEFGFSISGGLGRLRGAGGPGAGDYSRFIEFLNQLESSIASTFDPAQLASMTAALEDFRSAEVRMKEGSFDAIAGLELMRDRLTELADAMGPGFARLFRDIEHGTAESTAEAVEALLVMSQAMEQFGVNIYNTRALLEEAAFYGESYAETLARITAAQATLDAALFTAEERQDRQLATAQQRIDEFNASLGLTGEAAIDTREELQAYADSLSLANREQHAAYLALLDIANAFQLLFESAEAAAPAVEETAQAVAELEQEAFDASGVMRDVVRILADYVNWSYRLADAINSITQEMAGWELALNQANSTVQLFQLASAAGAPLDVRMQLFNQAFTQFEAAYNQAQQQISQDLQTRIGAVRSEYAELIELEREAADVRREALQSELDITREWADTLSSVEGIISGLQSGGLTPFGPSAQLALGSAGIADLQSRFAGATGAGRAQLGAELAQALSTQLGLTQGFYGVGPQSYLDEYNRTMAELTAIQEEAAAEAARQSQLEQALVDLEIQSAVNIERLTQQMDTEIAAAENHAQAQVDAVNNFALGVYAQFERVGQQLSRELLQQRLEQAQQEAENRRIQTEQLAALLVIRDGFVNAGLVDPTAQARANARAARYL